MRGTGPVTIGKEVVYAYFTADGRAGRLRLSADECDRLDLFAGQQVRLGLGDREPGSALVVAVVPAPPFAWVEVEFAGEVPVRRAG
jgi:hypothetical protein